MERADRHLKGRYEAGVTKSEFGKEAESPQGLSRLCTVIAAIPASILKLIQLVTKRFMEITPRDGNGKLLELARLGICPECRKQLGSSGSPGLAYMMLGVADDAGLPHDRVVGSLRAFLNIGYHGNQSIGVVGADMELVADLKEHQIDISFCSTTCLRGFFDRIVDQIETQLPKGV